MNYIKENEAFYSLIEENELRPSEIALWGTLFHLWNRAHWAKWFPVKNSQLTYHDNSTTVKPVHNARNILKQKGFIDFKTQGRNKKTWYSLAILFEGEDAEYGYDNEPIEGGTLGDSLRQVTKQPPKQETRQVTKQPPKQEGTIYKHKLKQETSNLFGGGGFNLNARAKLQSLGVNASDSQVEILAQYAEQLSEELVMYTIDQASTADHPVNWINRVLSRYENSVPRITTVEQAKADDEHFQGRSTPKNIGPVIPIYKLGE